MRFGFRVPGVVAGCMLLMVTCAFAPPISQIIGSDVIVTAAAEYEPLAALHGGERFPKGAQLLMIHDGNARGVDRRFCGECGCECVV